ncbi:hypothetical protein DFQ26_005660 [Actinomortierella ambigua]|nr:hypothetical protein DFQ26_005660 [Actinomortierella ambigua]
MACRFFRSIPDAIPVRDPYEEVFLLFTGEGASESGDGETSGGGGGPWQHNRSVSQTSNMLEVELAFTPVPTPPRTPTLERSPSSNMLINHLSTGTGSASSSRPSSRPSSRAGLRGVAVGNSMADETIASQETGGGGGGGANSEPLSPKPTSSKTGGGGSRPGSRRSGGTKGSSPSTSSPSTFAQQPPQLKPLVIHQSLSTLSQPGQTGSVVWDSSILMAKFLLSIRELQLAHFLLADSMQGARNVLAEGGSAGRGDGEQGSEQGSLDQEGDDYHVDDDGEDEEDNEAEEAEAERDEGWQTRLVFDPRRTSILELGSGCGLLGIVLVELCRRLLLTDQSAVLPLLMKNLKKNLDKRYFAPDPTASLHKPASNNNQRHQNSSSPFSPSSSSPSSSSAAPPLCQLQIQELVWGQDLDMDLKRGVGFDFVFATDVIYNESIIPSLVRTLADLCRVRERARQEGRVDVEDDERDQSPAAAAAAPPKSLAKTVVLLAQELRTDYVHLSFLEKMKAEQFRLVRIPSSLLDPEFHGGYVIYACWLR